MKKLSIFIFLALSFLSCKTGDKENSSSYPFTRIQGETMGTYYLANYGSSLNYKLAIDSILNKVNAKVSTYIPSSEISQFNQDSTGIELQEGIFLDNYLLSKEIFEISGGFYDPTVMPLVNYWGFGYDGKKKVLKVDSIAIEEMKSYVGLSNIEEKESNQGIYLRKKNPKVELDFSSVAKGYAVDRIASYLEDQDIDNFMVDIGGELFVQGMNPKNELWSIGINTPKEEANLTESIEYITISEKGIATSGNYRNFYDANGIKIAHTINPISGYPEISDLLSVTIIANSCAEADALATACMVLGRENAAIMLSTLDDIDAMFVYNSNGELAVQYMNEFKSYLPK